MTIIVGIVTAYAGRYVGQPLYCSTPAQPLYYDAQTPPWVALPVEEHGVTWECGDLIYISTPSGSLLARAWDAGPFGGLCVMDEDKCTGISADVPMFLSPFVGASSQARVVNVTAACRDWGICD